MYVVSLRMRQETIQCLIEIDSPEFKSFPAPYTIARLGDALTLTCEVDSNPPANILWTKNGEFVGGGSQYQIPEVHDDDYAVYACIGTLGGQFTKIVASTKVLPPGIDRLIIVLFINFEENFSRTTTILSSTAGFNFQRIGSNAQMSIREGYRTDCMCFVLF